MRLGGSIAKESLSALNDNPSGKRKSETHLLLFAGGECCTGDGARGFRDAVDAIAFVHVEIVGDLIDGDALVLISSSDFSDLSAAPCWRLSDRRNKIPLISAIPKRRGVDVP